MSTSFVALLWAYVSPHVARGALLSHVPRFASAEYPRGAWPERKLVARRTANMHPISMAAGVPVTGSTLRAALKWQCDATGAGYAIY